MVAGGSQGASPNQTPQGGADLDAQHPDVGWTPFEASTVHTYAYVCIYLSWA